MLNDMDLFTKAQYYDFEKLFKDKGYSYFTKGQYNLNIIGIRANKNNKVTNLFDDILVVIFKNATGIVRTVYSITTEPGKYYMQVKLGNKKGTAILVPGQYKGCWKIGVHNGKYKALVQAKPVKVYRDSNLDDIYDLDPITIDDGNFGINIHRSNQFTTRKTVDMYSAGCQVFAEPTQYNSFLSICEKQRKLYGNSFTYTLLNEDDLC